MAKKTLLERLEAVKPETVQIICAVGIGCAIAAYAIELIQRALADDGDQTLYIALVVITAAVLVSLSRQLARVLFWLLTNDPPPTR